MDWDRRKMRAVITRVTSASAIIEKKIVGKINHGLLILLGIERNDEIHDVVKLIKKIITLRIFDNNKGMNKCIMDVAGGALVISQFTLCANTKKGCRPSFNEAESPIRAKKLYNEFCKLLNKNVPIQTGTFGAHMQIKSINDGPVTIILNTNE